jgi:hypothetical protein
MTANGEAVSLAVEGKVDEKFDDLVKDWLARDGGPSDGKRTRLDYLCSLLASIPTRFSSFDTSSFIARQQPSSRRHASALGTPSCLFTPSARPTRGSTTTQHSQRRYAQKHGPR